MTTMTITITTTIMVTKTITMAGSTIIKYQKTIQLLMHLMMIMMAMMATLMITIRMIMTPQETGTITPKMRNMKMTMLMNLEVMIKMQMTLNKLKKILVQEEEEADGVCTISYPALIL